MMKRMKNTMTNVGMNASKSTQSHDWNKEYMPINLWETINYEVRYNGDIKKFPDEETSIKEAVHLMDPQDVYSKALIFERRQNPYYSDESECLLIGAVNYLGKMEYA